MMEMEQIKTLADGLVAETEKIIIGKRRQIEFMVMAALSGGHILLDDLPGSGKTTLVKALSIAMGCSFKRVQFTPDLLPSDILGMNIFNQKTGDFQLMEGPVQTNILLADEINRAIPRTQSALLEAMEERQVTIDGEAHELPKPFLVMATQNPVESESTFQLPAAQMDRFFVRLSLGYPSMEEEMEMLTNLGDGTDYSKVQQVASPKQLEEAKAQVEQVQVADEVKEYIIRLVHATRGHKLLKSGASPRASRSLYQGGKTWAAMAGRDFVTPDDIQTIAMAVLAHRIQLNGEARFAGHSEQQVIEDILRETPVPPEKEELFRG
jgi:MoxR-like ATPase